MAKLGNNKRDRVNKPKKKTKRKSKESTSSRRLQLAKKQVRALELRLEGKSFRAIACELKYRGPSGAYGAVEAALKRMLTGQSEELRQLELLRLDQLQLSVWARAASGSISAIETVLMIMRRRAKLLGLDAPIEYTIDDIRAIARKVHLIINSEVEDEATRERIFDKLGWVED